MDRITLPPPLTPSHNRVGDTLSEPSLLTLRINFLDLGEGWVTPGSLHLSVYGSNFTEFMRCL